MVLGITKVTRLGRFKKSYKRLSKQDRESVESAVAALLNVSGLPPGRRLEKVQSSKDVWAIRVSKGIRLTFKVVEGVCILRNVGDHDKTLGDA